MYGLRGFGRRYGRGLGRYGLGFSYYDLLSQADLQSCGPLDTACVASNQEKQAAVEDLWVNNYESNPNTANAPAPQITVTANTSPAVVGTPTSLFEQNQPANEAVTTINNQSYTTPQLEAGPIATWTSAPEGPAPPVTPPPAAVHPAPALTAKAPAPTPQAQGAPVLSPTLSIPGLPSSIGGFDLSSIPWWGWAAAAGFGILAFGGHRR